MASVNCTVAFELALKSREALAALAFAAEVLDDAQESQPWNADLGKAAKALRYAAKRLTLRIRKPRD